MSLPRELDLTLAVSGLREHTERKPRATEWPSSTAVRVAATASLALATLLTSGHASAGGPIGSDGKPITTSEYSLDLFQGPLFAGSRVTSLGGAYVAIAEDVDGDLQNPAAPAVRPFFSYTHFDYWLGFGVTFPADLQNMDFFNSGSKTHVPNPPNSFVFFTPAVNLQWGEFAIGLNLAIQNYALSAPVEGERRGVTATIPTTHLQIARGFEHNQLVFGVGVRYVSMTVNEPDQGGFLFRSSGPGFEFGGVWKPESLPLRLGIAYRTPIVTQASYSDKLLPNANGDLILKRSDGSSVYLPKSVSSPWDLNFGFAVQFGARPINPPWRSDEELIKRQLLERELRELEYEQERDRQLAIARTSSERTAIEKQYDKRIAAEERAAEIALLTEKTKIEKKLTAMNRRYVQVAASMLLSGAVENSVGVESLVNQTVQRSGQHVVLSPRLGVEVGAFPDFLKLRAGTYLEPTRFDEAKPRMHATGGLDLKLLVWNVFGLWPDNYMWRLGLGFDGARDYYTWGLTIAGWYPRHKDPGSVPDFTTAVKAPLDP
ncbi:MAG TPA: hypothetical protein VER11_06390 [Polyangiaceae bacterium]|nr:hypothetical protein [Polyangiaceae bacterium]